MTSEMTEAAVGSMVTGVASTGESDPLKTTSVNNDTTTRYPPPPKEGYLTALSDPIHYHVKHPLQYHWTLHQKIGPVEGSSSRGVSEKNWDKALRKSVTIGTVEDFWCVYNSMQDVTTIPENCDYFFMRQGIEPKWEDPANKNGCEARFPLQRSMDFMNMWKMTLLSVVGCQYTDYQVITGVQFAFRPSKSRICLWMGECSSEVRERIRLEFTKAMESAANVASGTLHIDLNLFQKHQDSGNERRGSGGDHRRGDRGDRGDGDRRGSGGGWGRSGSSSGVGAGKSSGSSGAGKTTYHRGSHDGPSSGGSGSGVRDQDRRRY